MGDLAERIRLAKQKLNNVTTRVTREDGVEVVEARSSDGQFTVVAQQDDEALCAIAEEQENGEHCGTSLASGTNQEPAISNRRRKKIERARRHGYVIDLKPDLQVAAVVDGVFLGSQDVAHDFSLLKAHRITHVVNAATGIKNCFPTRFVYLNIDVLDLPTTDLRLHFQQALPFMHEAVQSGGGVFVHCNAGVSRSATLVIAYLMLVHSMNFEDALQHVKSIRPSVRPNDGFMRQLKAFDVEIAIPTCVRRKIASDNEPPRNACETASSTKDDGTSDKQKDTAKNADAMAARVAKADRLVNIFRKMGIVVCVVFTPLLAVIAYLLATGQLPDDENYRGDVVSLEEFQQKFLAAGEVRRVVDLPSKHRAVAVLQDGAIVDGKPYDKPMVVVEYPAGKNFTHEIRAFEDRMGIVSPKDNVNIEEYSTYGSRWAVKWGTILLVAYAVLLLVERRMTPALNRMAKDAAKKRPP